MRHVSSGRVLSWNVRGKWTRLLISLALVGATLLVYWQVPRLGFVNFDDPTDVFENPQVQAGLTRAGIVSAFLTVHGQDYWRPLTRLSLMLDTQLGGPGPRVYHLTNLLLHTVNTVLLFLLLGTMTGCVWRSALVALLFAVHPLHVESVAWITERKDVLSMLFWILAIFAYLGYARKRGWARYVLVLLALAAGLMSKPTVVTLPVVLLLLDFWPLGRFKEAPGRYGGAVRLALEKVPMLVLAGLLSAITIRAQAAVKTLGSLERYPLDVRLSSSIVAYARYIVKLLWPSGLAFFYPYPRGGPPAIEVLAAATFLGCATIGAIFLARRAPYVAFGWFFYLVTLLPMIGIVQVGNQSMADRYSYIPLTGLFIVAVWGIADLAARWRDGGSRHEDLARPARRARVAMLAGVGAGMPIAALMVCASIQVGYWRDSIALCTRALAVTEANPFAHTNLGEALSRAGRMDEAIPHFREAIRIDPDLLQPRANLVLARIKEGNYDEAVREGGDLLRTWPDDPDAHQVMGRALAKQGRRAEAAVHLAEAVRLRPGDVESVMHLGVVLAEQGEYEAAAGRFSDVLRIDPDHAAARRLLDAAKAHRR